MTLEQRIEQLSQQQIPNRSDETLTLLQEFRAALNRGQIRVADRIEEQWKINLWVKKGLLLHLWLGLLSEVGGSTPLKSFDLDTLPLRQLTVEDKIRILPGGSYIRDGSYLAEGVTCMSPVFVNIGVYVGANTVLDSHVMVGACTQIGEGVHVGPGTQISGVINPLEYLPSIIGNDVIIGGNCGLHDGVCIGDAAVLAPGTVLSGFTRLYDSVRKLEYKRVGSQPLVVPPKAIVASGARFVADCAATSVLPIDGIVIGYRDQGDLEKQIDALRL
jgi:2,3,4,5-tetrahydropyridine-2,6-dicarboxylate N-succinyltransferase